MKKYKIVNSIVKDGITYYQIQSLKRINKQIPMNTLGGYISSEECLSHDDESWIWPDSYVTDSKLIDNISIYSNTIVTDSIINGKLVIQKNCVINSCYLNTEGNSWGIIENNTQIIDKTISFRGTLDNRITNSQYWKVYKKDNITVYCGQSFCKTNCVTLSYRQCWEELMGKTDIITKYMEDPNAVNHTRKYTTSNNIEWLKTICKQELKRLNIKIEEGD